MKTFWILALFFKTSYALSNVQVYPTRVYLNPQNKTATVSLKSKSTKPEVYRISTMFYQMNPDGSVVQKPELSLSSDSASELIRFSPKRVVLQPGVEQTIRISARNLQQLNNREVRTHLYFRPEDKSVSEEQNKKMDKKKSSFGLTAVIAIAIPVVVSSGILPKSYDIKDFKIFNKDDQNFFKFNLVNLSKGFLYGDTKVYYKKGSKKILVGSAIGISSYITERVVSYPLINEFNTSSLASGEYELEFVEYSQKEEKDKNKGDKKSLVFKI